MARALVIVESIAKATRIQGMLGPDYIVKPSIGHIRDLPQSAADIPASVKGEKWARLGINVHDHFKPVYVVSQRPQEDRRRTQGGPEAGRRALPRDRRGPRGRGDRLAPPGGAESQGAREAHGLSRDHAGRDRQGGQRDPRPGPAPRRRPGGTPLPRPPGRLRGLARCCGARSTRPARPVACSRWRSDWSASASASAWTSRRRPGST
jgi:hypothetical protein